jgi:two-component sensor histidine kinase
MEIDTDTIDIPIAAGSCCADHQVIREIHHRVKNNLQVVCSLLRLQSRDVSDSDTRDIFKRSEERIQGMALVYDKLAKAGDGDSVALDQYLKEMLAQLLVSSRTIELRPSLSFEFEPVFASSRMATNIGLLTNEIFSNFIRHRDIGVGGELLMRLNISSQELVFELIEGSANDAGFSRRLRRIGNMEAKILDALLSQVNAVLEDRSDESGITRIRIPQAVLALV